MYSFDYLYCLELIEECSTDLLLPGPSAKFTSLDSDNDGLYDANLDCVWTIESSDTQIVKLQIDSMDIQADGDCSFDFLEVHCVCSSVKNILMHKNTKIKLIT